MESLFPVFEAPVTYDTPDGDVNTNFKLIVRKDNHKILSCMTNDYKLVQNKEIYDTIVNICKEIETYPKHSQDVTIH